MCDQLWEDEEIFRGDDSAMRTIAEALQCPGMNGSGVNDAVEKGENDRNVKKLIKNILNVFYPRCCPVCQKVLKDQNRMICPECEENLHPVGHPRCFLCGKPVNAGEYCRDCEKHHHLFDQGIGIFCL